MKNIVIQTPNYSNVLNALVASENVRGLSPRNFRDVDMDNVDAIAEFLEEKEINIIVANTTNFIYKLVKSSYPNTFVVLGEEEMPGIVNLCDFIVVTDDDLKISIAREIMYPSKIASDVLEDEDCDNEVAELSRNESLKNIRNQLGLTQEDLELLSNGKFSHSIISKMENDIEFIDSAYSEFLRNLETDSNTKAYIAAHEDVRIRGMRLLLNKRQEDVAEAVNTSVSSINRIERGFYSDIQIDVLKYLRFECDKTTNAVPIDYLREAMQIKFVSPNFLIDLLKTKTTTLPSYHTTANGIHSILNCTNRKPFTVEHYLELLNILNNIQCDIDSLCARKKSFNKSTFFRKKASPAAQNDNEIVVSITPNGKVPLSLSADHVKNINTYNTNNIPMDKFDLQTALRSGEKVTNDTLAENNQYIQMIDGKLYVFTLVKNDIELSFSEILRTDWRNV